MPVVNGKVKLPKVTPTEKIEITFLEPEKTPSGETPENFNLTVGIHACFNPGE